MFHVAEHSSLVEIMNKNLQNQFLLSLDVMQKTSLARDRISSAGNTYKLQNGFLSNNLDENENIYSGQLG